MKTLFAVLWTAFFVFVVMVQTLRPQEINGVVLAVLLHQASFMAFLVGVALAQEKKP